ncbi:hypothetical protein NDA11_002429 [Ustilago hordei]|nr:hypothetical protein NDA11_002429 [Ustilago hordei]
MVSPRHAASLLLRNTARSTTKPTFQRRTLLAGLRIIESPLKPTLTSPSSSAPLTKPSHKRTLHTSNRALSPSSSSSLTPTPEANETEHAVISTFDLFSVGIGPSSSHTVGPMRAGVIFVSELADMNLLHRVHTIKINLYGSLALTGAGHMTPQALLGGLEGDDCETVDPPSVPVRFEEIKKERRLHLAKNLHKTLGGKGTGKGEGAKGGKVVDFDYERDLKWMFGQVLPHHSNGIRMSVFDQDGEMLATNDYYSVGGGFVVNGALATPNSSSASTPATTPNTESLEPDATPAPLHDEPPLTAHPIDWGENVFYKQIRRSDASDGRRSGSIPTVANLLPQVEAPQSPSSLPSPSDNTHSPEKLTSRPSTGPPFPFHNAASLLRQCKTHNLTIAQVVYENELTWNSPEAVHAKLVKIWTTMDECIRAGVESGEEKLPGPLGVKRPVGGGGGAWGAGRDGPGIEGGVGGASSMDLNFLLTASAIGMLFKRGATLSAAEGGCMAEVGVATAMAAAGFVAVLGGSVEKILQASVIGIEHNLGLTCDPLNGQVQIPCIERNALGAVKAVTAAQLALAGDGTHSVKLDDAITAMRETARDMHTSYKETSLGGLATAVRVPVAVPDC